MQGLGLEEGDEKRLRKREGEREGGKWWEEGQGGERGVVSRGERERGEEERRGRSRGGEERESSRDSFLLCCLCLWPGTVENLQEGICPSTHS